MILRAWVVTVNDWLDRRCGADAKNSRAAISNFRARVPDEGTLEKRSVSCLHLVATFASNHGGERVVGVC